MMFSARTATRTGPGEFALVSNTSNTVVSVTFSG